MVGLGPDIAIALSLASRARELMTGIPALAAWQISEGRVLKTLIARQRAPQSELDPA